MIRIFGWYSVLAASNFMHEASQNIPDYMMATERSYFQALALVFFGILGYLKTGEGR